MSSKNPHFTFNYVQPDEYHFSHDSVFLAREVFERFTQDLTQVRALDLCSGCGIVGLDFLYHCKTSQKNFPKSFDFLEVQTIYQDYFKKNCLSFGSDLPQVSFVNQNYEVLKSKDYQSRYDLILSNPPYFRLNQGLLSPSEFKNRCRFFIDSDFKNLIEAIHHSLKPQGSAFILLRDLTAHGVDALHEAQTILGNQRRVSVVTDIRGTPLVHIS